MPAINLNGPSPCRFFCGKVSDCDANGEGRVMGEFIGRFDRFANV